MENKVGRTPEVLGNLPVELQRSTNVTRGLVEGLTEILFAGMVKFYFAVEV